MTENGTQADTHRGVPVPHAHAMAAQEILEQLSVSREEGLSAAEAEWRVRRYGPNAIEDHPPKSAWKILGEQFRGLVVWLLVAASVVSFVFGEIIEAAAILVVLALNASIGFFTEMRAVRSMEALRQMGTTTARVRREGRLIEVPSEGLVPGDVVAVEGGDVASADLRLLSSSRMEAGESALTGESLPISKSPEPVGEDAPLAERSSMLYKGTSITRGSAEAVVVATGMATELGAISALVAEAGEQGTPLEERLDDLGRRLVWAVLLIAAVIAGGGILSGKDPLIMVQTAVALSVAAIPEGLPIVATIALARGMFRMAKRNALVNRLAAVETLGSTGVILTDKTGTLTEDRMAVARLVVEPGEMLPEELGGAPDAGPLRELLEVGALCNNASLNGGGSPVGDPLEVAFLAAAKSAGVDRERLLAAAPRVGEEAFDAEVKMMATYHRRPDGLLVAVKGAPERVLDACAQVRTGAGEEELGPGGRTTWDEHNKRLAGEGLRVLAVAAKESSEQGRPYEELTLLGLVGLADPPRGDTAEAISRTRGAGIEIIMVTGDQPVTASTIARSVGLVDGEAEVLGGHEIPEPETLKEDERERLLGIRIFARVTPKQKLDLVALHQAEGSVVAMTGDGVNDAPALKAADIGVAMGMRGTQVAREAADVVLKDDAFSTITFAVEQGRVIFGNIRKFVTYLLSCNVSEILIIALASFAGAPLPILPLQILFLNLVTDVFPALALGVGEGSPSVMNHPPRRKDESLLARHQWVAVFGYAAAITASVLAALALALAWLGLSGAGAVTVSFLTLAFTQLFHVFNMREASTGPLRNDVSRNLYVWLALALCAALLVGATYLPVLSTVLALEPPGFRGWAIVMVFALLPLLAGESAKGVGRIRAQSRKNAGSDKTAEEVGR